MFGYAPGELVGVSVEALVPRRFRSRHPEARAAFFADPRERAMGAGRELHGIHKDGREVPVEIGLNPIETDEGMLVLGSVVDVTERRRAEAERLSLEEQLRQSQKLEALGRLAGGIAHDFNNILSRRQALELGAIDLVSTVEDGARLLRAALPANVRIELDLDRPNPVIADAASVHAVLMNLGTNALHAMPDGGLLRITLAPFYARDSFVRSHPGLAEGHYVKMSVTDCGAGMDEETSRRAFEPFFTTKPLGTGSGLGLSTVHGLMRDHAGAVWIDSALGRGTSVHCLFPAVIRELERDAAEAPAASLGNGERVLFVDDEDALAKLGVRQLGVAGYQATPAVGPRAALELLRRELPVIVLTGRVLDASARELEAIGIRRVLEKPVALEQLAREVRFVLSGGT
jgi:PAS domain S-box-containing protein